ncbi:MAG: hypothetical protein ACE5KD_04600 [Candidatus Bathyarchaeia archaeon]
MPKKILLPKNVYATLESVAQAKDLTTDEMATQIILENVRR